MRLTIRVPSGLGRRYAPERFAPDAFEPAVGTISVILRGPYFAAVATMVSAEVVEDGAAAILELDFPALEAPE